MCYSLHIICYEIERAPTTLMDIISPEALITQEIRLPKADTDQPYG